MAEKYFAEYFEKYFAEFVDLADIVDIVDIVANSKIIGNIFDDFDLLTEGNEENVD